MHEDDDNDRPTRDEILERYGWAEGEREQVEREMAERQVRIDAETREAEAKARAVEERWAAEKAAAARRTETVVTRNYGTPVTTQAGATMTKEWSAYIDRRIKKAALAGDKVWAAALAGTVGKDLIAVERSNAELLTKLDATARQLNELAERLDKLEVAAKTSPASLRAVS